MNTLFKYSNYPGYNIALPALSRFSGCTFCVQIEKTRLKCYIYSKIWLNVRDQGIPKHISRGRANINLPTFI